MKKKWIVISFLALALILGLFLTFSTLAYQHIVNETSVLADNQCLKVNPLIIARKNSYLASVKILQASGSAQEYSKEMKNYFDLSKEYVEAQNLWLKDQRAFMDRWDFQTFTPGFVKAAGQAQYNSREADVNGTKALFALIQPQSEEIKKQLTFYFTDQMKRSKDANDEYNRMWDSPKPFDLRTPFIRVPESKCPPENFNIPDVPDFLNPPVNPASYGVPLS